MRKSVIMAHTRQFKPTVLFLTLFILQTGAGAETGTRKREPNCPKGQYYVTAINDCRYCSLDCRGPNKQRTCPPACEEWQRTKCPQWQYWEDAIEECLGCKKTCAPIPENKCPTVCKGWEQTLKVSGIGKGKIVSINGSLSLSHSAVVEPAEQNNVFSHMKTKEKTKENTISPGLDNKVRVGIGISAVLLGLALVVAVIGFVIKVKKRGQHGQRYPPDVEQHTGRPGGRVQNPGGAVQHLEPGQIELHAEQIPDAGGVAVGVGHSGVQNPLLQDEDNHLPEQEENQENDDLMISVVE